MASGFKDDEAYDVYDQPWRKDQTIGSNIYRPGKNIDKDYTDDYESLVQSTRSVLPPLTILLLQILLVYV